jgi:putative phosphoesterase
MGEDILKHTKTVDEVWHGGDWGDISVRDKLPSTLKIRGVYGNIDGLEIRNIYPKELIFSIDGLTVYMIHIGGYPGRYIKEVKDKLLEYKPNLYICGHSHICKVMKDKSLDLIHFNPGAIGLSGFHKKRTML